MEIKQKVQELRDGWVRIEQQAQVMLTVDPQSKTAQDALELAQNALKRRV